MSLSLEKEASLLDKLDAAVPTPLAQFDAFPKLPVSYKARSDSRGLITLFIGILAFLLILNDLGEYVWGWPDYEFNVDNRNSSYMDVNVDMVVNTPCPWLSVDLRDVVGDRLYLSKGFHREGTLFDIGQATTLKEHAASLSARQAVAQSRKTRGVFSIFSRTNTEAEFRPTYNYKKDGSACRIFGSLQVKKVTANLHVTTLGHGYMSHAHVDHKVMNLSHVITEFSFGPYFPDITQPLDYSFELTHEPFVSYQYFLHVVPTTYIAPRSPPLHTNQYSVTHYTRVLAEHTGTPGIFFKFDLDPMEITIHQRTTSLVQLFIRCVGVIGGIFTCTAYFVRATQRAVDAVSGVDTSPGIVAAEATGIRRKWTGGHIRARSSVSGGSGRVIRQGNGWVVEGAGPGSAGGSPYTSYAGTPVSAGFGLQNPFPYSPYTSSPGALPPPPTATTPATPSTPGRSLGLGLGSPGFAASNHARKSSFGPVHSPSTSAGANFQFPPTHSRTMSALTSPIVERKEE